MSASRNRLRRFTIRGLVAALGVTLVLLAVWHASHWRFVCDDAYIALRYAKHWGQGHGAVYNVGQTSVQGYTSPLWVALIALVHRLGAPCVAAALWLNALGALFCAVASVGLATAWVSPRQRALAGLLCLAYLAACPEYLVWSSGGLETSFAAGLGLLALCALQRGRLASFHVLAALAACVRFDTLVWTLPAAFLLARKREQAAFKTLWRLVWVAPGCVLGCQYLFYGQLLPQTFAVKQGGLSLGRHGLVYLQQWALGAGLGMPLLLALTAKARYLPWLCSILANLLYVLWVGGDFMGYSRFLLPSTVLALTLLGAMLAQACGEDQPWRRTLAWLFLVLTLGGLVWAVPGRLRQDEKEAWLDKRYESVHAMERFAAIRIAAGKAFATQWPARTRVTVGAAGAFAFAAELLVYDAFGLTDPLVLSTGQYLPDARPGHRWIGRRAWVEQRRPQLRCEIGWVGKQRPGQKALELRRPLTPDADWACQSTGPVQIRGQEQPLGSQYYCCVRERFEDLPAETP